MDIQTRALSDLAVQTDAAFYSPAPVEKPLPYAPLVRRRMGSALARYFLRQMVGRLTPREKT